MNVAPQEVGLDASRRVRRALGRFPTGVAIVTARTLAGARAGVTINSFCSLSLEPPLVGWALDRRAASHAEFSKAPGFAVNVLRCDHEPLARWFASPVLDRFSAGQWRHRSGCPPLLEDAVARLVCETVIRLPMGDHDLFVGRVLESQAGLGRALVFHDGSFGVANPSSSDCWTAAPAAVMRTETAQERTVQASRS